MKRIAILIYLSLAIATGGYGQALTTTDMMNILSCNELNCAKDFITKKGFSFEKVHPVTSGNVYLYLSDKTINLNGSSYQTSCALTLLNNGMLINAGYRTVDKNSYNQVLEGFKRLGFTPYNNNSSGDKIVVHYNSDRHKDLDLMVTTEKLHKGQSTWTSYDFELLKK